MEGFWEGFKTYWLSEWAPRVAIVGFVLTLVSMPALVDDTVLNSPWLAAPIGGLTITLGVASTSGGRESLGWTRAIVLLLAGAVSLLGWILAVNL